MWDKSKHEWKQRLKGPATIIGRIYSAHPGEGERFYLRILLNHVTGCTSSEDIRTLSDGMICNTYKEAARKRGLLEDDQECDDCLTEAASCAMPSELRQLFVTLLFFNEPADPLVLWNKHKESLSEDFLFRAKAISPNLELDEHILNSALLDIEHRLEKQGKSLTDFGGMPDPSHTRSPHDQPRIIQDQLGFNVAEQAFIAETNVPLLNPDQLEIFNCIMTAINDSGVEQRAFFIDGPGGTGKTYLYNILLAKVRSQRHIALATASSGIAALLLTQCFLTFSDFRTPSTFKINSRPPCVKET